MPFPCINSAKGVDPRFSTSLDTLPNMSFVRSEDYQAGTEEKGLDDVAHVEDPTVEEVVVDADAKGFVDHTLVVDDATNRRLLRMINWR
jgi:hypothetical protein